MALSGLDVPDKAATRDNALAGFERRMAEN
jgi:hypothetical protein